ncbi:group II intron maturase-specific domain-containing protein [Nonomuraea polychroma]|uniref:group II intron maturase-specific domain-containing protein n=1 Tax=Nonomuraea polychroma TaxID=46176 RepID=UPI00240D85F6|nr:group II intron maturase-specific domain-containing protein [Nonomuraea polychroma]
MLAESTGERLPPPARRTTGHPELLEPQPCLRSRRPGAGPVPRPTAGPRRPSRPGAIQAIKEKVKAKTYRSTRHMSLAELIVGLNRLLRGWANYFRHAVAKDVFNAIDSFTWRRVANWIFCKHSLLSRQEMRRRFCRQSTWKIVHDGIELTGAASVKVTRYRYRGHNIATPSTPTPAAATPSG